MKSKLNFAAADHRPSSPEVWRTAIRVSYQGKRGKDGRSLFLSPDEQLSTGRAYATARGGAHDDDASWANRDIDQSGYSKTYQERPGIMRHLQDARDGLFRHIVFVYTERSSRELVDGVLLYREFTEAGVQVHYADIGLDPADDDYEFVRDLNLLLGNRTSRSLSRKVSRNMRRRAEGDPEKGIAPLPHGVLPGWIEPADERRPDGGATYRLSPWADTLRRLVDLRLAHEWGRHRIALQLAAEGHATSDGGRWTAGRVGRYLSPEYVRRMRGEAPYHANAVAAGRSRSLSSEELWIAGAYPALIDEDTAARLLALHERTRRIAEANAPTNPAPRGPSAAGDTEYLIAGVVFCAVCGGRLTPSSSPPSPGYRIKADTIRTYRCFLGATAPAHGGRGVSVSAGQLEDATARAVRRALLTDPPAPPKSARRAKGKQPRPGPTPDEEIGALQGRIDRLALLVADGALAPDEFARLAAPLRQQQEEARERARKAQGVDARARALSAFAGTGEGAEGDAPDEGRTEPAAVVQAWRQVCLWAVERVEAPFTAAVTSSAASAAAGPDRDRNRHRSGAGRRFARITLRWEVDDGRGGATAVWFAPLYSPLFAGERLLYPATAVASVCEEGSNGNLIEFTQHPNATESEAAGGADDAEPSELDGRD